jgi:pimeloyl-ACP methyl ester carboxylesterase
MPDPLHMPEVEANGLLMTFEDEGEGPPLVLLHGATSVGTRDWGAQRPLLRQHFRLLIPDARGHGGTRWDVSRGWQRDDLVDDLAAFLDALGLERVRLMGLSMGGVTSLHFASRYPDRVEAMVVAGATNDTEPPRSIVRRQLDLERIDRDDPAFAAEMARLHDPVQGPGAWRDLMTAIRDDILSGVGLTPEALSRVRVPVLLAYGDADAWVPLEQVIRLRGELPQARLLIVPGGHVVPAERPGIFNPTALAFLRRPPEPLASNA